MDASMKFLLVLMTAVALQMILLPAPLYVQGAKTIQDATINTERLHRRIVELRTDYVRTFTYTLYNPSIQLNYSLSYSILPMKFAKSNIFSRDSAVRKSYGLLKLHLLLLVKWFLRWPDQNEMSNDYTFMQNFDLLRGSTCVNGNNCTERGSHNTRNLLLPYIRWSCSVNEVG